MMRAAWVLPLAFASIAAAAQSTTVVGVFAPDWDKVANRPTALPITSTAASIVDVNAIETTYAIGCQKDAPTSSCSIENPMTIIQGETTMNLDGTYTYISDGASATVVETMECSFTSFTVSASCSWSVSMTGSVTGVEVASSASSSSTFATDEVGYWKVTVTDGASKLSSPQATETPGAAATGPAAAFITAGPALVAAVVAMI